MNKTKQNKTYKHPKFFVTKKKKDHNIELKNGTATILKWMLFSDLG